MAPGACNEKGYVVQKVSISHSTGIPGHGTVQCLPGRAWDDSEDCLEANSALAAGWDSDGDGLEASSAELADGTDVGFEVFPIGKNLSQV